MNVSYLFYRACRAALHPKGGFYATLYNSQYDNVG